MQNDLPRWFTVFTESERGWGQNVISVEGHDTEAAALAAADEQNSKNDLPYVPDYYIYARVSTDMNRLRSEHFIDKRTPKASS